MPYDPNNARATINWSLMPDRCSIAGLYVTLVEVMRLQDNLRDSKLDGEIEGSSTGELISGLQGELHELERALTYVNSIEIAEELGDVFFKLMRIAEVRGFTLQVIVEALLAKAKIRAEINGKDSAREEAVIALVLRRSGIIK